MEQADKPRVMGRRRDFVIALDRIILTISRHWLFFLCLTVLIYVGLPFLAPVFIKAGLPGPARAIYSIYSGLCHQLGYRSWYLFGERAFYPRAVFQQYTGINPDDIFAARAFIGNAVLGFKVAYCERDVAIYGALLLSGLIYGAPAVNKRVRPPHFALYLLVGVLPIAVDGFSQLFSQYPYNTLGIFSWLPYRESTPLLRSATGALFGLANAWLAFPYLQQSMGEISHDLAAKLSRLPKPTVSPLRPT